MHGITNPDTGISAYRTAKDLAGLFVILVTFIEVDPTGFEPVAPRLQSECSSN